MKYLYSTKEMTLDCSDTILPDDCLAKARASCHDGTHRSSVENQSDEFCWQSLFLFADVAGNVCFAELSLQSSEYDLPFFFIYPFIIFQ